jgi:mannose-1-phosphate guanylyltransferase
VDRSLVTFGIAPTEAATGFGYLQLGETLGDGGARVVDQFKEKPDAATAGEYLAAGAERYLWNSGMFVWKASTLMACIERFHPENHAGLSEVAAAWGTSDQAATLARVYPTLAKISVDFAVMEPASTDDAFTVAAVPMPLRWLDVGSWPSFGETREPDADGNVTAGCRSTLLDSRNCLVVGDQPDHLVTTIGLDDVVVIHTGRATLVCKRADAQRIKALHGLVGEQQGDDYL